MPQLNLDVRNDVEKGRKTRIATLVFSALFAVDVFFWLSGFLATISILN